MQSCAHHQPYVNRQHTGAGGGWFPAAATAHRMLHGWRAKFRPLLQKTCSAKQHSMKCHIAQHSTGYPLWKCHVARSIHTLCVRWVAPAHSTAACPSRAPEASTAQGRAGQPAAARQTHATAQRLSAFQKGSAICRHKTPPQMQMWKKASWMDVHTVSWLVVTWAAVQCAKLQTPNPECSTLLFTSRITSSAAHAYFCGLFNPPRRGHCPLLHTAG